MRLHRFYISQPIEKGKELRLEDTELIHQFSRVFRFETGDRVVIFDGSGFEYEAHFTLLTKKEAVLEIENGKQIKNIPEVELHIFQSIIKKDNFEFVAEKCTEIGASAFHPIVSERSEKKDLNIERLKKIVKEASEQCGRAELPEVFQPEKLEMAISNFSGRLIVMDLGGKKIPNVFKADPIRNNEASSISNGARKIGILIGPEGGWSETERKFFQEQGIEVMSFGPLVLRAETASIVASSLILLQ